MTDQSLAVPAGSGQEEGTHSLNAQFIDDLRYMAENAIDDDFRALFTFQLRRMAELLIGYRA